MSKKIPQSRLQNTELKFSCACRTDYAAVRIPCGRQNIVNNHSDLLFKCFWKSAWAIIEYTPYKDILLRTTWELRDVRVHSYTGTGSNRKCKLFVIVSATWKGICPFFIRFFVLIGFFSLFCFVFFVFFCFFLSFSLSFFSFCFQQVRLLLSSRGGGTA